MSLLGIDIGTTNLKAAAFSEDGVLLAQASREYPTLRQAPGRAELDSTAVYAATQSVIREVATATSRDPVTAMAFSGMGEAMTPVSADRRILGNAIIAVADSRGAEYVESLVRKLGKENLYSINPNIPTANYSYPKLAWLRDNNRELFDQTDKFVLFDGLFFHLCGLDAQTSYSHANRTMLFDLRQERWSDTLLQATGMECSKLPETLPTGTITGMLPAAAARDLGLPPGVVCVVGAHDQCSNALGAGISTPGRAVCGIGTVECVAPIYGSIPDMSRMLGFGLNIEHAAIPGQYTSFIYNQGGSLVKWYRNTFAKAEMLLLKPEEDIYALLNKEMPSDPTRLLVLPYWEPTGAPGFISDVAGTIAGLTMETSRGDILKGILECETFYFLDSLETLESLGIDTKYFVATGGGSRSDAWLQIKADIFGVPFERCTFPEAGVLGAVMIAATATGVTKNYQEAVQRFVKPGLVFHPEPGRHSFYQEKYGHYKQLFTRLKDILAWTSR